MFRDFLTDFPQVVARTLRGRVLSAHALMIALTALLVFTGADWAYFEATRGHLWQMTTLPAAIIGFFVPILVPVGVYALSLRSRPALKRTAVALAQAGAIGWLTSSTYKALTGRIEPEFLTYTSTADISRNFNFGLFEHGIFWGWPSSHTTVAFAMSFALLMLYPKNKTVRFVALFYAFFIGISVSVSIHWLSDFIAGAILGGAIGITVGRYYAKC